LTQNAGKSRTGQDPAVNRDETRKIAARLRYLEPGQAFWNKPGFLVEGYAIVESGAPSDSHLDRPVVPARKNARAYRSDFKRFFYNYVMSSIN